MLSCLSETHSSHLVKESPFGDYAVYLCGRGKNIIYENVERGGNEAYHFFPVSPL